MLFEVPAFACGHPRTPENTRVNGGPACLTCIRARAKEQWAAQDPADRQMDYLVRALPDQIERAREKYIRLLKRARGLGMTDLLNDTWDRTILEAQAKAAADGGSIGFGDGMP